MRRPGEGDSTCHKHTHPVRLWQRLKSCQDYIDTHIVARVCQGRLGIKGGDTTGWVLGCRCRLRPIWMLAGGGGGAGYCSGWVVVIGIVVIRGW